MLIIMAFIGVKLVQSYLKDSNKKMKVGATYMNMSNPFFVRINDGIKQIISGREWKLIALDSQLNIQKQIEQVEYLINEGVDLIFINPVDWKEIKPALIKAKEADIPVVIVDAPVYDTDLIECTVQSDNYSAGILCANDMIKRLGGKGNIVLLEHLAAKSAIDRIKGFEDVIKHYPDIKIIGRGNSEGQLEIGMDAMQNIMQKGERIDAIMCLNDPTALGALAALEDSREGVKALIYGIDGSENVLRMIKEGKITATAAQFPDKIGREAGVKAVQILSGIRVEAEVKVPVKLIDKENLNN